MKAYYYITIILLLMLSSGVMYAHNDDFNPATPTEPASPFYPDLPSEPQNPFNPDLPSEPQNPFNPDLPSEPQNPFNPDLPSEPQNPFNPDLPSEPQNPFNPDLPSEPQNPFNPDLPSEPDTHFSVSLATEPAGLEAELHGGGLYKSGTVISISQTQPEGYEFLFWSLNGQLYSEMSSFNFVVTSAVTFIAHYKVHEDNPFNPELPAEPEVKCETTYGSVEATAEGSYTWSLSGETYTESGQYEFTTQNVAGCDSIVTLHLTITEPVEPPCETTYGSIEVTAEGSYTWTLSGETYTKSGQYEFTTQNIAGCDSVVTLNLTITEPVEPPCEATYGSVEATAEGSYTWTLSGETYTESGQYEFTTQNIAGCDSIVTLNLTITEPVEPPCETTYGSVEATAEGSYTWTLSGETYTESGQYEFTTQNVAGCDSIVTLNLTITEPVEPPCETTYGSVEATAEGSYTWTLSGETYTESGQYEFTIVNVAGCDSIVTLNLTITEPVEPPCETTYGSVSATAESSYTWSLSGETYTESGQYEYTMVNVAGCDSIVTLNLTITQPVEPPCETTYGSVEATAEGSYTWTLSGETYTVSGQYEYTTVNVAGCDSIVTLNLTITQPIEPPCETTYGSVEATAEGSYTWTLSGETYTESGQYEFTTQNIAGCDSIVTLNLTITEPVEPPCETTYGSVEATAEGSYTWTLSGETYTESGQYEFTTQNVAGCDSIVTLNLTITESVVETFRLTLLVNDEAMGSVTGAGEYERGTTIIVQATARDGFRFAGWSDGEREAKRYVTLYQDVTLTANFEPLPPTHCTLSLSVNDEQMGQIVGSRAGTYLAGNLIQLEAKPYDGYRFVRWSDGVTNAQRSFILNSDLSLTAYFEKQPVTYCTVTLHVNDEQMGYVRGSGNYERGSMATIEAIAYSGYRFLSWSDGNTAAVRHLIVYSDLTLTANFEPAPCTAVYNTDSQTICEGDEYNGHTTAGVYVDHFTTAAGCDSIVTLTLSINEVFEIAVVADNSSHGTTAVVQAPSCDNFNTAIISATANSGYRFVSWSDGNSEAMRTLSLSADMRLVARFEALPPTFTITLLVNDETYGYTLGAGEYEKGTTAEVEAVPYEGYRFLSWTDGNADNPRLLRVSSDLTLTAYFVEVSTAAEQLDSDLLSATPQKVLRDGHVIIIMPDGSMYDVTGRRLNSDR